jgi:hypothetical protein
VTTKPGALLAMFVALAAFGVCVVALLAATPVLLGLVYGCLPPRGSCGDTIGWAMVIASPIWVPVAIGVSAVIAVAIYLRLTRPKTTA